MVQPPNPRFHENTAKSNDKQPKKEKKNTRRLFLAASRLFE